MWKFTYEPDDGDEKNYILEPGRGWFRIEDAHEHITKAGVSCLKVTMTLTDSKKKRCKYFMYIMPTATKRLRNLCAAINRHDLYNPSCVIEHEQLIGYEGQCQIKTEEPEDPRYSARSVIEYFITRPAPLTEAAVPAGIREDDIPF
jgi:hypothetical protein